MLIHPVTYTLSRPSVTHPFPISLPYLFCSAIRSHIYEMSSFMNQLLMYLHAVLNYSKIILSAFKSPSCTYTSLHNQTNIFCHLRTPVRYPYSYSLTHSLTLSLNLHICFYPQTHSFDYELVSSISHSLVSSLTRLWESYFLLRSINHIPLFSLSNSPIYSLSTSLTQLSGH